MGLGDFGKPGSYFERQFARWTSQYRASETQVIADMDRLIAWLETHMPADDDRVSSTMRHTGIRPAFIDKLELNGVSLPKTFFNSDTSAKVDVLRRGQRRSA